MVAPADTMLYLAEPYSPCTSGFCRKAWLSLVLHAHWELSECHELLCSRPATNLDLSAVPVQILRGNSLHQTSMYSTSNSRINCTGTNQLSIFGKRKKKPCSPLEILPQQNGKEKSEKQGSAFCMESVSIAWIRTARPVLPKTRITVTKCEWKSWTPLMYHMTCIFHACTYV